MPQHSLEYNTRNWKFTDYIERIVAIKDQFETVVVCVHSACVSNGYWVDDFTRAGIQVIEGARVNDRNCLHRMRRIMESFETMTANGIGSHIAYAAASGTKIAVYGDYAASKAEHYKNDKFFRANPDLLDPIMEAISESKYRELYPFLFCDPDNAQQHQQWGEDQLGVSNVKSPAAIKDLLGFDLISQKKAGLLGFARTAYRKFRKSTKAQGSGFASESMKQIRKLPKLETSEVSLAGKLISITDPDDFLAHAQDYFGNSILKFHSDREQPVIIDAAADVGVGAIWLKTNYPDANITAFEPDPSKHKLLVKNLAVCEFGDVTTHNRYPWIGVQQVPFRSSLGTPFRRVDESASYAIKMVESVDLKATIKNQSIDLLKLRFSDNDVDLIDHLADGLEFVDHVFVEYESLTSSQPNLDRILAVLKLAGFKWHLRADNTTASPFVARSSRNGISMRIGVFAFRP
jgi:hypothetical protein